MTEKTSLGSKLAKNFHVSFRKNERGGALIISIIIMSLVASGLAGALAYRSANSANNSVETADNYSYTGYRNASQWQKFKKELQDEVAKCENDWGYTIENISETNPKGKVTVPDGAPISEFSDEYLVLGKYDIDSLQPSATEDYIAYQYFWFVKNTVIGDGTAVGSTPVIHTSGSAFVSTNVFDVRFVNDSLTDSKNQTGDFYLIANTQVQYYLWDSSSRDVDQVHRDFGSAWCPMWASYDDAHNRIIANLSYTSVNASFDGTNYADYSLVNVNSLSSDNLTSSDKEVLADYCTTENEDACGALSVYKISGITNRQFNRLFYMSSLSFDDSNFVDGYYGKQPASNVYDADYVSLTSTAGSLTVATNKSDWRDGPCMNAYKVSTISEESDLPNCSIVSTFLGSKIDFDQIEKTKNLYKNVALNMSGIDKFWEWTKGFWTNGKYNNEDEKNVDVFHVVHDAYKQNWRDTDWNGISNAVDSKYTDYHDGYWDRLNSTSRLMMFQFFDFADSNFNKQISEINGVDVYGASANYTETSMNGSIVLKRDGVRQGYTRNYVADHDCYIADSGNAKYHPAFQGNNDIDFTHTSTGAFNPVRMCGRTDELDDHILNLMGFTNDEIAKVKAKRFYMVMPGMTTDYTEVYDWKALDDFCLRNPTFYLESAANRFYYASIMGFTYTIDHTEARQQLNAALVDLASFKNQAGNNGEEQCTQQGCKSTSDNGNDPNVDQNTGHQFKGCLDDDGDTCVCENCLIQKNNVVKGTDNLYWIIAAAIAAIVVVLMFFAIKYSVQVVRFFAGSGKKAANIHDSVHKAFGRRNSSNVGKKDGGGGKK